MTVFYIVLLTMETCYYSATIQSVCLSVCVSFEHVTFGRGSVLVRRRSDTLCTSGFMDDVMFAHKPRLLDVAAQLKRSAHAALGLAINCAQ